MTGASRAIDALLSLAYRYDVPEALIGVTLVAVGTSLPELGAHVTASVGILSGALDYRVTSAVVLGGSVVGVLTLGIAASFPELSTVLDGIRRKTPIVAVGTLVGSNIVNPLLGFGLGGVISTYHVPTAVVVWDLPFKVLAAVGLLVYVRYRGGTLRRHAGVSLIGVYFVHRGQDVVVSGAVRGVAIRARGAVEVDPAAVGADQWCQTLAERGASDSWNVSTKWMATPTVLAHTFRHE